MKATKTQSPRLHTLFTIIIIFLLVYAGAFFVSLFKGDVWYKNLKKPLYTPPDKYFSIIWMGVFFFLALTISLLWKEKHERPHITTLFSTNILLSLLWSIFFFGLHQPTLAFFELLLLVLASLGTLVYAYKIRKLASLFFIPFLLWILFITYFNFQIAFIL